MKDIADNSAKKQGTVMRSNDKTIPVISLEKLLYEITPEEIILITTKEKKYF